MGMWVYLYMMSIAWCMHSEVGMNLVVRKLIFDISYSIYFLIKYFVIGFRYKGASFGDKLHGKGQVRALAVAMLETESTYHIWSNSVAI